MDHYTPGDHLILTAAAGTSLGTVVLDGVDGSCVLGTFEPAPESARVADLFGRFEELVDAAALGVLPAVEREIAALGLRIGPRRESAVPADDVQIYADGGFSCHPVVAPGSNGLSAGRPGVAV